MINIFELNRARDEKEIRKIETYRNILDKIYLKIVDYSSKGVTQCFYEVPPFIIGLPKFDMSKCIEYLLDRLFKNGLAVMYIKPNIVYCNWDHIPSTVKKPELKAFEDEIIENPYRDYSKLVAQVSGKEAKMPNQTYINHINNTDTYNDGDAYIKNNNNPQIGYLNYFVNENNNDTLRVTNNVSRLQNNNRGNMSSLQYNPNRF
jgi:hypothetical protein